MSSERDIRIDMLRTIALFCIMLAHVNPPPVIFDIRNFDVVCMVFIMGMSYGISTRKEGYIKYLLRRFQRLVIPAWIFLAVYFVLFSILGKLNAEIQFSLSMYIRSFLLLDGIGYVWIIRVYMLIAILCPVIRLISDKVLNQWFFLLILTLVCMLYMIILNIVGYLPSFIMKSFINYCGIYMIGYGMVSALGYRYRQFKLQQKIALLFILITYFVFYIVRYGYISIQQYKYPPAIYYLSYGMIISILLYEVFGLCIKIKSIKYIKTICWISKNSLWLYFWHIIPVSLMQYFDMGFIEKTYMSRLLFCIIVAVVIVIIQNIGQSHVTRWRLFSDE